MNELQFESKLINYIANDCEENSKYFKQSSTQNWQYLSNIKTIDQLWENLRSIIFKRNQDKLNKPLSDKEFEQIKSTIKGLTTPYKAGQFLYGMNGKCEIEIETDDNEIVYLNLFEQSNVGSGTNIYQVVNQVQIPNYREGDPESRFDTTFLINGLPIIQVEEKRAAKEINQALNQMHQYIKQNKYSDIFSTLQILVAMNPHHIRYMANTTVDKFNKDFAFEWKNINNENVLTWTQFADTFLSIPMAHNMSTKYMILDGEDKQLKVMRPYQVYATERTLNELEKIDFGGKHANKVGYIWHTTGSGKTITSFKTAWLARNVISIDKVIFVVDRKDLNRQTLDKYSAYDPSGSNTFSSVSNTKNTKSLEKELNKKSKNIVITTIQKLGTLCNSNYVKDDKQNYLFIVDEAHRSVHGQNFKLIQEKMKNSAWIGYTGTPMFEENKNTQQLFGPCLHQYTIKDGIRDGNVLRFDVDFKNTIKQDDLLENYLPEVLKNKHENWDDNKIQNAINSYNEKDIEKIINTSIYDDNDEHISLVVKDIVDNFERRSSNYEYSAILTVSSSGNKASTPLAGKYFKEFVKVNNERLKNNKRPLKICLSYSYNDSNNDYMIESNEDLRYAINYYNKLFDTNFSIATREEYAVDFVKRLKKQYKQKNKNLDLLIVVNQYLTGFDNPKINTLYVDRVLNGANLIQAYSRTNRIENNVKKQNGKIINYRFPTLSENLMNEALALYADENSSKLNIYQKQEFNKREGLLDQSFPEIINELKNTTKVLRDLSDNFTKIPDSEAKRQQMYELYQDFERQLTKASQTEYEDSYKSIEEIFELIEIEKEESDILENNLRIRLKEFISEDKNIPISMVELEFSHVKNIIINYDYINELLEKLASQVKKGEDTTQTIQEIDNYIHTINDDNKRRKIKTAAGNIVSGKVKLNEESPYIDDIDDFIETQNINNIKEDLDIFRYKWGIQSLIDSQDMIDWFSNHKLKDVNDLNIFHEMTELQTKAVENNLYQHKASDENVKKYKKNKYRAELSNAIYNLADEIIERL